MKRIRYIAFIFGFLLIPNVVLSAQNTTKSIDHLFKIEQYQGKVVYLDFWASWCKPCRKSFPWMNQLQSQYSQDKLVIVAVNLDKDKSLAENFLVKNPANFKIIYDPNGQLAKYYRIKGMPSSIIFDKKGKAIKGHSGFFEKNIEIYEQEINHAINGDN